MDYSLPLWSSLADSLTLRYDTVQLNRIEWMLTQVIFKLSVNDELKVFAFSSADVPDPRVSGPSDAGFTSVEKGNVSKSKRRRVRVAETKRRMWARLQECVESSGNVCRMMPEETDFASEAAVAESKDSLKERSSDCIETPETLEDDASGLMKAMFQTLISVESRVDGGTASAEESGIIADQAWSVGGH